MASTIAQLIMEQGRQSAESRTELAKIAANALTSNASAAAEAARQKGQIWGGAINQIGQSIVAIPGNIERAKTQDLQRQDIAAQVQERQATAKKQQDAETEGKAVDAIMAQSLDPQGNLDAEGFTKKLIAGGHASALKVWAPFISTAAEMKTKREVENQKLLGEGLYTAWEDGTPDGMKRAATVMASHGAITPDDATKFGQLADAVSQSDPVIQQGSARTLIAHLGTGNTTFMAKLDARQEKETTRKKSEAETEANVALAEQRRRPQLPTEASLAAAANPGDPGAAVAMLKGGKATDEFQTFKDAYIASLGKSNWNQLSPTQQAALTPAYAKAKSDPAAERQAAGIAAQTAQQGRAQNFETLKTARADIQKNADTPFQTAKSAANELRDMVTAAQQGNKIAAAEQSLATAAAVVKSFNLNRINTAEIGVPASAGSAVDRFLGLVGKYKDGQPIDASLQKDMLQVADLLDKKATKTYVDTHSGINKLYGTNIPQTYKTDVPTPAAAPPASSGLTYQDYLNSKKK